MSHGFDGSLRLRQRAGGRRITCRHYQRIIRWINYTNEARIATTGYKDKQHVTEGEQQNTISAGVRKIRRKGHATLTIQEERQGLQLFYTRQQSRRTRPEDLA